MCLPHHTAAECLQTHTHRVVGETGRQTLTPEGSAAGVLAEDNAVVVVDADRRRVHDLVPTDLVPSYVSSSPTSVILGIYWVSPW
jgi:hypothetical protein